MKQKLSTVINQPSTTKPYNPPQSNSVSSTTVVHDLNTKMVPIQLTLPAPVGSQDTQPRIISIQVPASALASKLHFILCTFLLIIVFGRALILIFSVGSFFSESVTANSNSSFNSSGYGFAHQRCLYSFATACDCNFARSSLFSST